MHLRQGLKEEVRGLKKEVKNLKTDLEGFEEVAQKTGEQLEVLCRDLDLTVEEEAS